MRLAFWRKAPDLGPRAAPTAHDRKLRYIRFAALAAALVLLVLSFGPLVVNWAAPNSGADINVTTEFYTAFEHGGGFVSWDFSPDASKVLRARIDALGDGDGNVTDGEFAIYKKSVSDALHALLVFRNFEIGGVRVDEQRGIIAEQVNSSTPAHVHVTLGGQWAEHDADIVLARDAIVAIGYNGTLQGSEQVHERTIIINGGLAAFTSYNGASQALRVPGGNVIVSTRDYSATSPPAAGSPDVRFARFSLLDSSLVLLAPVAIGYVLAIVGLRREQQATGQPRVVPLHNAVGATFLLLMVAYFAGVPGLVLWVGGCAFGVAGLMLAFRFYPADRVPLEALAPAAKRAEASSESTDWQLVTGEPIAQAPGPAPPEIERMLAADVRALSAPAQVDGASLLAAAHRPLSLPSDPTPRPDGRAQPVRQAPAPPAKSPPPEFPAAGPASAPKTRVRCPGCKHHFEAEGSRPLSVTCPHCGRRGVLR